MDNRFLEGGDWIIDQLRPRPIPEYDDQMWQRGYKPFEILEAPHKDELKEYEQTKGSQKQEQLPSDVPRNINVDVKVQKK